MLAKTHILHLMLLLLLRFSCHLRNLHWTAFAFYGFISITGVDAHVLHPALGFRPSDSPRPFIPCLPRVVDIPKELELVSPILHLGVVEP